MSIFATVEAACVALDFAPFANGLQLLDAAALIPHRADWPPVTQPSDGAWSEIQGVGPYQPIVQPFPLLPTRPALLCALETVAPDALAAALRVRYPGDHELALTSATGVTWRGPLAALAEQRFPAHACLYVAPLAPLADLLGDGPVTVITRLLGPQGCPWDREQTHRSLRKDLLGETHEVLEAIDAGEPEALAEELGDLLLQVLLHAEIGRQAGEFTLGDIHYHLATKLIRRHPHVFGDTEVDGSATVLRNWDAIKQAERAAKGQTQRGTLDGLPVSLPALSLAQETLKKAAKAGFDADSINWDWAKLHEELAELAEAAATDTPDQRHIEEELGDLLLILAKLARRLHVDAESALREAIGKYRRRFAIVERLAHERQLDLHTLTEADKIALWREAKSAF